MKAMNRRKSEAVMQENEQLRAECSVLIQMTREIADELAHARRLVEEHRRADYWRQNEAERKPQG